METQEDTAKVEWIESIGRFRISVMTSIGGGSAYLTKEQLEVLGDQISQCLEDERQ